MSAEIANPFKGLEPYGPNDELFGRDADLVVMKDRLFSARTTLLFAGSGVGKTSFFQAKLIPEMESQYPGSYAIRYHNQWAGRDPLQAVKETLGADAERSLRDFFTDQPQHWILVLDQFEELFLHHAYWTYFENFLNELCEVINSIQLQARIVFSMREEFLGHLSVFDNRIPDLFNNYYRLKNPDLFQAADIITSICDAAKVQVNRENLKHLIAALSRVEIGGVALSGAGRAQVGPIERNFVIPPYLQLVCHELWDLGAERHNGSAGDFVFLSDYQSVADGGGKNPARLMLEKFCARKMKALLPHQQGVVAKALDFLVTSQGAKIAYESKTLSRHMQVSESDLDTALAVLSQPDTRILRVSVRQQERWYELYHDMYARIMFEWKEHYEKHRRRQQRLADRSAPLEGFALRAEAMENRDKALLLWLNALDKVDTDDRRRQAGRLCYGSQALLATFRHEGPIVALAFAGDQRMVATASKTTLPAPGSADAPAADQAAEVTGTEVSLIQVWSLTDDWLNPPQIQVEGSVSALAMDQNGTALVAVTRNKVHLWETSGRKLGEFSFAKGQFVSPRFNADGSMLLLTIRMGPAYSWMAVPRKSPAQRKRMEGRFTALAFSPDGKTALVGSTGGKAELRHAATGKPLRVFVERGPRISAAAFSPDGAVVAAGNQDGIVQLWRADSGEALGAPMTHSGRVAAIAFSRAGKILRTRSVPAGQARQSGGPVFRKWSAKTGSPRGVPVEIAQRAMGHSTWTFSPDTSILIERRGPTVAFWDADSGRPLDHPAVRAGRIRGIFSPDRKLLLAGSTNGTARLWRADRFRPLENLIECSPRASQPLDFTSDGRRMVTASADRGVKLWKTELLSGLPRLLALDKPIVSVAVSPKGRFVAALGEDKVARVWNVRTGAADSLPVRSEGSLLFSPREDLLAILGEDNSARLWSFSPSHPQFHSLRGGARDAVFSPNSRYLATTTGDGESDAVALWDVSTRRKVARFRQENDWIQGMVFSPDSRMLLTCSDAGPARLWKVPSGERSFVLAHQGPVSVACFSRDGKYVATSGADGQLRVWKTASGEEVSRFRNDCAVLHLAFSENQEVLLAATDRWAHTFSFVNDVLKPRASRELDGRWTKGCRCLDSAMNRILVMVRMTGSGLRSQVLKFDSVDAPPLRGKPETLLEHWQKTLSLRFEGDELVPVSLVKPIAATVRGKRSEGQLL